MSDDRLSERDGKVFLPRLYFIDVIQVFLQKIGCNHNNTYHV